MIMVMITPFTEEAMTGAIKRGGSFKTAQVE
jgi:hypothetical protein